MRAAAEKRTLPGKADPALWERSTSVPGSCREGWSRRPFSGRTLARRGGKHHLWRLYTATAVQCQIIPWRRLDVRSDREVLLVPLARDDLAGHADDDRVGRHRPDYDGVGANAAVMTDRDRAEHLGAGPDGHPVAHGRMSLAALQPVTAESDAMVERHVGADLGGLPDDHSGAMVDEQPRTEDRAGSTATSRTDGLRSLSTSPTPVIVPPVPTPATKRWTAPSVWLTVRVPGLPVPVTELPVPVRIPVPGIGLPVAATGLLVLVTGLPVAAARLSVAAPELPVPTPELPRRRDRVPRPRRQAPHPRRAAAPRQGVRPRIGAGSSSA